MHFSSIGLLARSPKGFESNKFTIPSESVPVSHNRAIISVLLICAIFSWALFATRVWTRTFLVRSLGYDDLAMLIALIFFSVFCAAPIAICVMVGTKDSLPDKLIATVTSLLIVAESFYVLTMIALKVSLGFFFYRIMVSKFQRISIWVILFFSTGMGLGYLLFLILGCGVPVTGTHYWESRLVGSCVSAPSMLGMSYTYAVLASLTDLLLTILPIPMLMKTKISRKEKWIVAGIFAIATAGFTASIVRMYWIPALNVPDFEFLSRVEILVIWSAIEPGMGLSAASLASLRPLLRLFVRRVRNGQSSNGSRGWFSTGQRSNTATSMSTGIKVEKSVFVFSDSKSVARMDTSLNTVDPPDFLHITQSGSSESLELKTAHVLEDYPSSSQRQVRWNDGSQDQIQAVGSSWNDRREWAYPPQRAVLPNSRVNRPYHEFDFDFRRNEEDSEEERDTSGHGRWWPLPGSSVISGYNVTNVITGGRR